MHHAVNCLCDDAVLVMRSEDVIVAPFMPRLLFHCYGQIIDGAETVVGFGKRPHVASRFGDSLGYVPDGFIIEGGARS